MPNLLDLVDADAILPRLRADTRDAAIVELLDALIAANPALAPLRDALLEVARQRERQGSTGFGKGIAVPHIRHADLPRISAAIGIAPDGIDFAALDHQPVRVVVLMLSPRGDNEAHITAMEVLFGSLNDADFRAALAGADSRESILDTLRAADTRRGVGSA